MISLRSADTVTLDARASVLNTAYADYFVPLHVSADQMATMDILYDVDAARSVVAVADGVPVGMALLSRRGERAWISAVGVIPAWRQRGIARRMMEYLLSQARAADVRELTLEVISENHPARTLYDALGFVQRRELLTWRFPPDGGPLPIPRELLLEAPPEAILAYFPGWHDQPASWQREPATLSRMIDRLRGYRLDLEGKPAAYCLVGERGDNLAIFDVGINPDFGPLRAGRPLLQALWFMYRGRALTMLNVPADDSLNRALAALHFLVTIRQIEMQRPLTSFARRAER